VEGELWKWASLSVGVLLGEPGGGLIYWGFRRTCKERLWRRASLSMWALLKNLEEDSFNRDFPVEEDSGDGYFSQWGLTGEPGEVCLPGIARGS